MHKRWIICLAAVLLYPCLLEAANFDGLKLAKERLNVRLEHDAKNCAKVRAKSVLLGPWATYAAEPCKTAKNFSGLVKQTPREELPEVLVNIFIDDLNGGPTRGQYPPLEDYLVIFGEPAVAQLVAHYEEVPERHRGNILRALGEIGSEKALTFVRSEVKKLNSSTLPMAAYTVRLINKEAAKEDLLPLLRDPRIDDYAVTAIVRHLTFHKDPGWHDIVLDLAQQGKITFQTMSDLGSYDQYPEAAVTTHLHYLLARWTAGDSDFVACLLYQIHERNAVKQWFPILEDLLRAKYDYLNRPAIHR